MSLLSLLRPKSSKKKKSEFVLPGTVLMVAAVVVVIAYAVMAMIVGVSQMSKGKILARTIIGTLPVGDMTYEEATQALDARTREVIDAGITSTFEGEQFTIALILNDPGNAELAYPLVSFDTQETIAQLKQREAGYNPLERLIAYVFTQKIDPSMAVDDERLRLTLEKELAQYETPAQDAKLVVQGGVVSVQPETSGQAFPHDQLLTDIPRQLLDLTPASITLELQEDYPDIDYDEALTAVPAAQTIIANAPYIIGYEDKAWKLDTEMVTQMIAVLRTTTESSTAVASRVLGTSDEVVAGLSPEALTDYLQTTVIKDINVEAQRGKFEMKGGRVVEFQASRTGLALDIDATIATINTKLNEGVDGTIPMVVITSEPDVTVGDVNTFGITELVATGSTNFKGSPKNRRFNINLAAQKLDGILIAPGETFSLVKALSPIDSANGYLPELVIKGNRTIPEVGGGLCQVGTTFFRLVLDAGLPVVERKNHSYRVSYYEPPVGMDATIYDPKPDFRFTNDYGSHLLLQTYVVGDDITFEFYGKKDGREASTTTPRVYNVVKPGPTKIIETTDLAPGQRKCIEKPHNGADAEFTYTVKYADGRTEQKVFTSHYRPWQEVCLVGVAEESPTTEETQLENAPDTNAVQ